MTVEASRERAPVFESEDAFNHEHVGKRAGLSLQQIVDRIEAVHQRFADELDQRSDADLAAVGLAPWHDEVSRLRAISGIAWHDGLHIGNIQAALQPKAD